MKTSGNNSPIPSGWLSPVLWISLITLTLAIFGGVVLAITLYLRADIRERIINRDGETFTAVAQMLLEEAARDGEPQPADLFTTALQTSRLSGVLAVRLHEPDGNFTDAVPFDARERPLSPEELETLRAHKHVSTFEAEGDVGSIVEFYVPQPDAEPAPLLHVAIPLSSPANGALAGIAYYTLDGEPVASEFRELDRGLAAQAGAVFGLGSLLFLAAAGTAFRRLNRAHRLLRQRTQSLLKANQELTLAAKSSAVGAVSAHLIHGLKNPLAGLNEFVRTAADSPGGGADAEDWQTARETAQRMREMIDEIVGILREEDSTEQYEMSASELVDTVNAKIAPRAEEAAVDYRVSADTDDTARLNSREANLVTLILVNLLDNALHVSKDGGQIDLVVNRDGYRLSFDVRDTGPGIPPEARETLFQPGKYSGNGGSGLGLAISRQLAQHLGAELELRETGPSGTVFRLAVTLNHTVREDLVS